RAQDSPLVCRHLPPVVEELRLQLDERDGVKSRGNDALSGAARREAEDGLRQAHHVAGAWARRLHNLLPRGKIADAPDLGPPGYPAGQVLGAYGADLHLLQLLEERG